MIAGQVLPSLDPTKLMKMKIKPKNPLNVLKIETKTPLSSSHVDDDTPVSANVGKGPLKASHLIAPSMKDF